MWQSQIKHLIRIVQTMKYNTKQICINVFCCMSIKATCTNQKLQQHIKQIQKNHSSFSLFYITLDQLRMTMSWSHNYIIKNTLSKLNTFVIYRLVFSDNFLLDQTLMAPADRYPRLQPLISDPKRLPLLAETTLSNFCFDLILILIWPFINSINTWAFFIIIFINIRITIIVYLYQNYPDLVVCFFILFWFLSNSRQIENCWCW